MNTPKKNKILIVDDEKSNIIALTNILNTEYKVYAVRDSREAIETAEEDMPDVILLDIIMPEMDGYEVLTALKNSEKARDIPVIFVTGLDSTESEEKGLALGAADYISKPFHSSIVKLRVQNQIKLIERDVVLKLKNDLLAAKEQAEHLGRVKNEFLSRMSHEMKTPVNAIMGMIQVAKLRGIPENIEENMNEIDIASRKLLQLINDVLNVSGMEYGTFKLSISSFDLNEMLNDILKEVGINASAKKQILHISVDPLIPTPLMGDENCLKQVVVNLLGNAVKFTPERGEIDFKARLLSDDDEKVMLQIEITDNGIGISKEQKGRIFDYFEQIDGGNTRKHGGIGIGLALSKRIVEMMDGSIWVESELKKGSKFIFTCTLQKVK